KSDAAQLYRTQEGVPIAIAFAFMSALYFRGKITYAMHFGGVENTFVIAPGFGLVPPTWCITEERMKVLSRTPVDIRKRNYRKPLERDARALAEKLDDDAQVVLLDSVASWKHVDLVLPVLRRHLRLQASFS